MSVNCAEGPTRIVIPRVYHFILDHRMGGPHVYVDSLRKAMAGRLESVVVTTGRGPMTEYSLVNLRHIWPPLYAVELLINALVLILWTAGGRIRRKNAVFAVHGGANLAPLMAARVLGIPVVWHFHETTPSFQRFVALGKWIIKGRRSALAVVAKKASDVYGLADAAFIPAFVDPAFWSPSEVDSDERDACSWNEGDDDRPPLRLLAVGNINPLKGFDVLLEALADIEGAWHLKIVGASLSTHKEYADRLQRRAAEIAGKHGNVQIEFLGWQDNKSVRALLATCDVYVLPSRSEACPIALLEAMSMQCRCAAADVGDVALMMKDYPNGAVFAVDEPGDCRKAIEAVSRRKAVSAPIAEAWRLDNIVANAENLYQKMASAA